MTNKELAHCPTCLSINVQAQCWIDANTNEIIDDTGGYNWCNDCVDIDEGDGEFKYLRYTADIVKRAIEHHPDVRPLFAKLGWDA